MMRHLALVEDNPALREVLVQEGYTVSVCRDRGEALQVLRERPPSLALIGATLGDEREGGFRLCGEIRRLAPTLPILLLSPRCGEADRIFALRLGADDCLTKDVSADYLLARITSLLDRVQTLLAVGWEREGASSLVVDTERCLAFWRGRRLDLTIAQFHILDALVSAAGQVRHHTQLMRAARIVVEPNTIAAQIKSIRDRFRAIDTDFSAIRTERGAGYRWVGPASFRGDIRKMPSRHSSAR